MVKGFMHSFLLSYILILSLPFIYSECTDSAMIVSLEYSLNDNSFISDYDGNSGIIQKIFRNATTGEYGLWQTNFLNFVDNKGDIYYIYSGNDIPFKLDSHFLLNRKRMLVVNPDVELVYLYPVIEDAKDGVIPFKIFARNLGVGGIDNYELKLNVTWKNYTYNSSFFFFSIPEEGYENTFYWNVTNIEPHAYKYIGTLLTVFDHNLSDNQKQGMVDFCPLPWSPGALSCNDCTIGCLNQFTGRYQANCNNIFECKFYDSAFALACNGYLEGSYAFFNETHDALCPDASIRIPKIFSDERLRIRSDVCRDLYIEKFPVLLNGETVLMDVVTCQY